LENAWFAIVNLTFEVQTYAHDTSMKMKLTFGYQLQVSYTTEVGNFLI